LVLPSGKNSCSSVCALKPPIGPNATLQGAYFMLAARSVGLDCGPMGGFNAQTLEQELTPKDCEIPAFAKAIGHEDKWLLHNGCPPRKDAKKNQAK
jgi:nitroreductase